jgi:hypothetical protein
MGVRILYTSCIYKEKMSQARVQVNGSTTHTQKALASSNPA